MDILKGSVQLAKAAVVDQTDVKKALIKATSVDICPPKEKHVQTLIRVSEGEEPDYPPTRLVRSLDKRLHEPEWIVVLKTLVVAHRLFIHGNKKFVNALLQKRDIFLVGTFTDASSQEALTQSSFIRRYARYLEEKLHIVSTINLDLGKSEKHFVDMTETQVFENLEALQSQLDVLFDCELIEHYLTNTATLSAYELLLRDSVILYRLISKGIVIVLDTFFSMSKENATKGLAIYKKHVKQEQQLIELSAAAKNWEGLPSYSIPEIRKACDPDVLASLEAHLSDSPQTARLSEIVGDKLNLLDLNPAPAPAAPPASSYGASAAVPKMSAPDAPVRTRAQTMRPQQPANQELLFMTPTPQEKASEILNLFNTQPAPGMMGVPMTTAAAALRARTGTVAGTAPYIGVPPHAMQAPPMMPPGYPQPMQAFGATMQQQQQRSQSMFGGPAPLASPTNPFLNPAAFGGAAPATPTMPQRAGSVYGAPAPGTNPFLASPPSRSPQAPAKVASPQPPAPPKNPTVDDFF